MLRAIKKLLAGEKKKDKCPVCGAQTFFHDNLVYADASDLLGPLGDITCGTCNATVLVAPLSCEEILVPMAGFFVRNEAAEGLTDEQAQRILAIAI